jgi:hypothetical protein
MRGIVKAVEEFDWTDYEMFLAAYVLPSVAWLFLVYAGYSILGNLHLLPSWLPRMP